jgi:hypothetical protein
LKAVIPVSLRDLTAHFIWREGAKGMATDPLSTVLARIREAQLTGAFTVDLSDNGLADLPEAVGGLAQVVALTVVGTRLTKLPETLGSLALLKTLLLARNQLTKLPKSIGQLQQLEILDLSNNRITGLPKSLGQLTRLHTLNLSHNQLASLPVSLGQLSQLRVLNLSNNRLVELPESLRQLKSLTSLLLDGNPELGLSDESLGRDQPLAMLEYYFKMRGGDKRPLNEAKLTLVGRGGVGKTSIVKSTGS